MRVFYFLFGILSISSCSNSNCSLDGSWFATVNGDTIARVCFKDSLVQFDKGDINISTSHFWSTKEKVILSIPLESKEAGMGKVSIYELPSKDTFSYAFESCNLAKLRTREGMTTLKRASVDFDINTELFDKRLKEKINKEWTREDTPVEPNGKKRPAIQEP